MTINLDSDLKNIRALSVAKEILDTYNAQNTSSTDEYEELLKSRFPIYYGLIQSLGNLKYTYEEYYYIADNGYRLKGAVESMEYLLSYLGITIAEITITNHLLIFSIEDLETQDPAVSNIYIDKLKDDLLLFIGGETSIENLIVHLDIKGDFIISGLCYDQLYESTDLLLGGDL